MLNLRGELNLEDILKIKHLISEYMKGGLFNIILNMERVSHIHLSGLVVLVERAERLQQYKGDLKIVGMSNYMKHIVELTGVSKRLNCYPSQELAEKAFQKESVTNG